MPARTLPEQKINSTSREYLTVIGVARFSGLSAILEFEFELRAGGMAFVRHK